MKAFMAFILTILAGVFGFYIGAELGLEGYLGIILAIATMGSYIISTIGKKLNKMA